MKHEDIWRAVLPRLQKFIGQTWNIGYIAELTEATPNTVGSWLAGQQPPVGIRLVTLWHFLDAAGIQTPELSELQPFNYYIGRLLAFRVITMDEAKHILAVKNDQTVLEILRGQQPSRPTYTLPELYELYDGKLHGALKAIPKLDQPAQQATHTQDVPGWAAPAIEEAARSLYPQGAAADQPVVLAMLLNAALPLARHIASDAVTVDKRTAFRELIGQANLFELLNIITALQSERARTNRR